MIVVTAPTSNIGRRVVARLLDAGEEVRLVARDPDKLPADVSERVEVVRGSHAERAVVDEAFEGAEAVFWLVPADPKAASVHAAYVDFSRPAVAAFGDKGVRRVVDISALGRGTPVAARAGYTTGSLAMDDLIAASGVAFRAVTNASFMDNIARQVKSLREEGVFYGPDDAEPKRPLCAVRDIAATAASLLLDRGWSGTGHRAVLGPEDISYAETARIMTEVLGRPIEYRQVPLDDYKAMFVARGYSDAMAQGMADMAAAKNAGLDEGEQRTAENSTPTGFRQWCEEELKPLVA